MANVSTYGYPLVISTNQQIAAPFMEESLEDEGVSHHVISNRVGKHEGGLEKPCFITVDSELVILILLALLLC